MSETAMVKKRRDHRDMEEMRKQLLYTAAKTFLEKGYTRTSLREIAMAADVNIGSLMYLFKTKDDILAELVQYVLDRQAV